MVNNNTAKIYCNCLSNKTFYLQVLLFYCNSYLPIWHWLSPPMELSLSLFNKLNVIFKVVFWINHIEIKRKWDQFHPLIVSFSWWLNKKQLNKMTLFFKNNLFIREKIEQFCKSKQNSTRESTIMFELKIT